MIYNNYVNKIKKIAKIKSTILRFKIAIISAFVLILGFTIFYNSCKGIVSGNLVIDDGLLYYGEEYNANGLNSFLSNINYEYSADGTTWTSIKPSTPGEYYVRGVSKKTFNRNSYSNVVKFTILPTPTTLSIKSDSITYGNNVDYEIDLVNDDYVEYVDFLYDDISSYKTNIKGNLDTLIIKNAEGVDVTDYYAIDNPEKEVLINKRDFSITLNKSQKVYDGKPLTEFEFNKNGLAFNDSVTASVNVYNNGEVIIPIQAGIYESKIVEDSIKIFNNNLDVTGQYNFNITNSTVEILKRPITIKTQDLTKEYDSTDLECLEYDIIDGNLALGDRLVILSGTSIKNVGTKSNEINFDILNENNESVYSSYDINFVYGKLEITPCIIDVITESSNKEYDSTELYSLEYSLSKPLFNDESIEIVYYSSITNVGIIENELQLNVINSNNYKFNYTYGTLEIKKRNIEVIPDALSKTYDGYELRASTYTQNGLILTHNLMISSDAILNVGKVEKDIIVIITDRNNNDVTSNYNIIASKVSLEILKREIVIDACDAESIYDGLEYKYNGSNYELISGTFDKIDSFEITVSFNESPINAGIYSFSVSNAKAVDDNKTQNYDIVLSTNIHTLTILKREIEIKLSIDNVVYDANVHKECNYSIISGSFVLNQEITNIHVNFYNQDDELIDPKDVGSYYARLANVEISGNIDNYNIIANTAYFEIIQREIKISPNDFEITYGDELNYNNSNFTISNDCENTELNYEDIRIYVSYYYKNDKVEPKNVGTYEIRIDSVEGITNNYSVRYDTAVLTINKVTIYIELSKEYLNLNNEINHIYDGVEVTYTTYYNNFSLVDGELKYDDELIVETRIKDSEGIITNPINVGTYYVYIIGYQTVDGYKNYNVVLKDELSFEIIKRTINFYIDDDTFEYDGTSKQLNLYTDIPFVDGDVFESTIVYVNSNNDFVTPVFAGVYTAVGLFKGVVSGDINNYNLVYDNATATLTISRRVLTIKIKDFVYSYNNKSFAEQNYTSLYDFIDCSMVSNQGLFITYNIYNENRELDDATYVGEYTIELVDYRITNSLKENYEVICTNGTISVKKASITIMPKNKVITYGQSYTYEKTDYSIINSSLYDSLEIVVEDEDLSYVNAGTYYITIKEYYLNNSDNYEVNIIEGTLEINKFEVDISLKDIYKNKVYDGIKYTYSNEYGNYNSNVELPYGDVLSLNILFNNSEYALDASTYTVRLNSYVDESGLTGNYDITFERQMFVISRRSITVSPLDNLSKYYDGLEFEYPTDNPNYIVENGYDVVSGEEFQIAVRYYYDGVVTTPINPGIYEIEAYDVVFINGKITNYNITYGSRKTLEIKNTVITIRLDFTNVLESIIYDGNYHSYDVLYDVVNVLGINIEDVPSLILNIIYEDEFGNTYDSIKDVGAYKVICDSILYEDDRVDYDIIIEEYTSPTTKILPKDLIVTFDDISVIYDGVGHNEHIVAAISDGFVLNDNAILYVSTNVNAVDAGVYDLNIDSIDFVEGNRNNYNILLDYVGNLVILQRDIEVMPIDKQKTYDALEYVYDGSYSVLNFDVVGNDTLTIQVKYVQNNADVQPINAGVYNIVITSHMLNGNENNYNIIYLDSYIYPAYLTINRRDVLITPNNIEDFDYDATEYVYNEYFGNYSNQEGLLNDAKVIIRASYYKDLELTAPINVGIYRVVYDVVDIENDILNNYNFSVTSNSFEIKMRQLILSSNQEFINQVYGFGSYSYSVDVENFNIVSGTLDEGLLHNDELTIYVVFVNSLNDFMLEAKNASTYTLSLAYYQTKNSYMDSNYDITFEDDTTFTISPRSLNLKPIDCEIVYNNSTYIYDGTKYIDTLDNNLVFNDSLTVSVVYNDSYKNEVSPKYAGVYNIFINDCTFQNGLKSNYDITYSTEDVYLTILKRDITLTPAIESKEYDGIEIVLNENSYTATNLLDNLRVTEYSVNADKILDARDYHISIVSYEFDNDDILNSYNVELNDKDITISKRSIKIYLKSSYTKVYDQQEYDLSSISYTLSKELVNDDILTISFETYLNGVLTEAKNVGKYDLIISDAYVNSNYEFDITNKSIIIIEKATVNVTPYSQESFKYDNSYVSYAEYYGNYESVSGLFEGLNLIISVKYQNQDTLNSYETVKDAGIYKLIPTIKSIDGDLINNFKIEYSDVSFEIYRREITISSILPENKEYDGAILYANNYNDYELVSGDEVLAVDTITLNIRFNNSASAKNASTYTSNLLSYSINGEAYSLTDISNYDITYNQTSFTIMPRKIVIDLFEETHVYDGTVLKYSNTYNNFDVTSGSLIDDEKIKVSVAYFDESYNSVNEVIDAGNYYVKFNDFTVTNSIKSNYDITTNNEYYSFIVKEKTLIIKPTTNGSIMYDGKSHSHDGSYDIVENYNVSEEEINDIVLTFSFVDQSGRHYSSVTNVGIYTISLNSTNSSIYVIQSDDEVTFEITKRKVIINPTSITHTYNGQEYIYDGSKYELDLVNGYSLINGQLNISVNYYQNSEIVSPINVGLYDISVVDINYIGNIDNYDFIYGQKEEALEITKADIEISPIDCNKTYDGTSYVYDLSNYSLNGTLYNEDNIEIEIGYSSNNNEFVEVNPINAGTYYIYILNYQFIGDESNYNVTIKNPSILKILKESIIVSLNQSFVSKTYDGIGYTYDSNVGFSVTDGTIYNNDEILLDIVFNSLIKATDAGYYVVSLNGYSVNGNSNIDKLNYDISLEKIEFEIYKKNINVELLDLTDHIYNGQAYSYNNDDYNYKSCDELVNDDKLLKVYVKYYQNNVVVQPKNVGIYKVVAYDFEMLTGNKNNYNFVSDEKSLEIVKKQIGISLKNQTMIYSGYKFEYNDDYELNYGEIYENGLIGLSNYEFEYSKDGIVKDPIEAGTYSIKLLSEIILDNYLVEIVNNTATLTITKRNVTISLIDKSYTYDGTIYDDYLSNEYKPIDLAYGDTLNISVKYTTDVEGLNEVEPKNADTYYIHVASHNLNMDNYNVELNYSKLVINPKNVEVIPNDIESFEFDGTTYAYQEVFGNYKSQEGLLDGVEIMLKASFNNTPRNAGNYEATFSVVDIQNDILSNYKFNISTISFEIYKINLEIETSSASFEYDGSSHSSSGFKVLSGLLEGYKIIGQKYTSEINAGVYDNEIEIEIYNDSAIETNNFNIVYTYGTITIEKRSITIVSKSATVVFNNKNQTLKEFTITNGTLADGDSITASAVNVCIYVGEYANELDYLIRNSSKEDVTDNYEITKEFGTIIIEKLVVEYYIKDVSEVYNGKTYAYTYNYLEGKTSTDNNYRKIITFDTTVYNENVESSLLNVGKYRVVISNVTTTTLEAKDSIDIYLYDESDNEAQELIFTITKKQISVKTGSASKIYDGKELSCSEIDNKPDLISGHSISVNLETLTTLTENGTIDNIFEVIIKDSNDVDVTSNYDKSYTYGKLSVTRDICFEIKNTVEYIGKNVLDVINLKVEVKDHETKVVMSNAYCLITGISFYQDENLVDPINVGEYQYVIDTYEIYQNGELIPLDNIVVHDFLNGNFTITKRNISIEIATVSKTYDGIALSSNDYDIKEDMGTLLEGHTLKIETTGSLTEAGSITNKLSSYTILDSNGNDVSDFYNLDATNGRIIISKRYVYVQTMGGSKTYDGTALIVSDYDIIPSTDIEDGLLSGHEITIKKEFSGAINAGEYQNKITLSVVDGETDVSRNYRIVYEYGTLTINKVELEITTKSDSKAYDGTPLVANNYEITNGMLCEGDTIVIEYSGSQTEIGMSSNGVSSIIITNADGTDVTSNYDIVIKYGTLEVY